jgi:type I restriction enzyme, S subunit
MPQCDRVHGARSRWVRLTLTDDLIENNTRRIKILEEMAQMLYREWFVNFRFPGHQKVNLVESELGPMPEGWTDPQLEQLLEHVIGGGWGEEAQSEEFTVPAYVIRGTDIPFARHGSVTKCPLRWHKGSNFKSRKLQAGDLVFEVSGGSKGQPVGRSLLVGQTLLSQWDGDVICASFCKLLRPKTEMALSAALYCFLLEAYTNGLIEKYQVQSTGISNFKFTAFVKEVRMPLPPPAVMTRFGEAVTPMLEAVAVFGRRNANLRTTRDLLLPKLISGELSVEAAEEAMEQTA